MQLFSVLQKTCICNQELLALAKHEFLNFDYAHCKHNLPFFDPWYSTEGETN